jgi:broad specificity phosphatase PhoE
MRLILVRHGETEWSRTGRHTGTTEVPLTDAGRAEALALVPALERWAGARVIASPRERAQATAALAIPGCTPDLDPRVAEWDYGDYEGRTSKDIRAERPGWEIWSDGCPGGESPDQAGARASEFVASLGDDTVIVFTHGHMSRVLAMVAVGHPVADGGMLASSTASVGMVETQRTRNLIALWNFKLP